MGEFRDSLKKLFAWLKEERIDLAYVASGQLDAYFERGLKPWDVAAGILLVTEAGGRISRSDGAPFRFGDEILATNGHVHAAMCDLLQTAAQACPHD